MNTLDVPTISRDNERIYVYNNHGVWFGKAAIKVGKDRWMSVGEVILKEKDGNREDAIEKLESLIKDVRGMPVVLYMVKGTSGDNANDQYDWHVAAYTDKKLAEEHCRRAMDRQEELKEWECPECGNRWRPVGTPGFGFAEPCECSADTWPQNIYDPKGYLGSYYSVSELPLLQSVPNK